MRSLITLLAVSALVLSSCGTVRESRFNPANWFGKSESTPREAADASGEEANPLIPDSNSIFRRNPDKDAYQGRPVQRVTALAVERTSSGAIIRATGVTSRQGAHDIRLTPLGDGEPTDGVLSFVLEAVQPGDQPAGAEAQRTVTAARAVNNVTLDAVTTIRVLASANERTSRR